MLPLARFREDERAIEGLPIRLVIAFVVGVASLSVMLNMISGVGSLGVSELNARPAPDVVAPGAQTVTVTAVDANGDPVTGATVVVSGDTATLDGVRVARTGPHGNASLSIDPRLGPNREQGTLSIAVKPPAGSDYADERKNTAILVVRDG